MEKICSKCKCSKPTTEFSKKKTTKDGLYQICKACHKEYNKRHYVDNALAYKERALKRKKDIKEWWSDYKSKLVCSSCGEDRHWCLDFHHTNPAEKDSEVSSMLHRASMRAIMEEIEKCVVLCRNCHSDLHYRERNNMSLV